MSYGLIKAKQTLQPIDLIKVPHKRGDLIVSPAFGPASFDANIERMSEQYFHSNELPNISFQEPTTSQSISAAAYNFREMAKSQLLDPRFLQLGRIIRTQEGVFANPPRNEQGESVIDEKSLKQHLNETTKAHGIYLGKNDFGFAPYETFEQGIQESRAFAESGLARLLEHADGRVAENLRAISSKDNYKDGVYVWGFDEVKSPLLRIADVYSGWVRGYGGLGVYGDDWGFYDGGCVFGVLRNLGEAQTQK